MTATRQMHLGAVPYGTGGPGSHTLWLDPEIPGDASVDIDWFIEIAQLAERGKFDLRLHRRQPVHHAVLAAPLPQPARAAHPAVRARRRTPATSAWSARRPRASTAPSTWPAASASLDLISGGRAGWNVVTTGDAGTAGNYGLDEHYDYDTRYGRAQEFVELARALWDSYEDDAFVRDRETGRLPRPRASSTCSTTRASTSRSAARSTSSARRRATR